MNGPSTPPSIGIPTVAAMRLRVFSTTASQPRFRRATDVFLLVPALIGIVALVVAYPPSRFERTLDAWLRSIPAPLDPVWTIFYELLVIWAVALIVLAVAARRPLVWLPAVGATAIATGSRRSPVGSRSASGRTSSTGCATPIRRRFPPSGSLSAAP